MERTGRCTILLAEDDRDQSDILGELLAYEGYQVVVAENATEVLERLVCAPDIVLLDVVGVSNPAVFRALALSPQRPAVVLVSADSRLAELAAQVGADAYLAKPYDLTDLLGTITTTLNARAMAREAIAAVHP